MASLSLPSASQGARRTAAGAGREVDTCSPSHTTAQSANASDDLARGWTLVRLTLASRLAAKLESISLSAHLRRRDLQPTMLESARPFENSSYHSQKRDLFRTPSAGIFVGHNHEEQKRPQNRRRLAVSLSLRD